MASIVNTQAVIDSNAKFAQKFLEVLSAGEEGNLVCSPLSALIALSMAYTGARGHTAKVMSEGLSLPLDLQASGEGFKDLITKLMNSPKVELAIANRMYVKQNFELLPEYVSALEKSYNASAEAVNFLDDATMDLVNTWVAQQTKDKIKNLITPGCFTGETRLVLINAVYFKGPWLHPFQKDQTHDRDFFLDETNKVTVPFMYQKKHFGYAKLDDLDAQLVELPYMGGELSMVIILPNQKTGLAELEKKLATTKLSQLLSQTRNTEVEVFLPKFKVESTLDLKLHLQNMGMADIFSNNADFSGITTTEPLQVSKVIQKAFIEVSEEGTEAAAATAVIMATRAMIPRPSVKFMADRPFFFALVNIKPMAGLFGGRLVSP